MPSLLEYLPAISHKYWTLYSKTVAPPKTIVVEPGVSDQNILPNPLAGARGIFTTFVIEIDNPSLVFNVTIDNIEISQNITGLNSAGYVGYSIPGLPWLSKYDTTNSIYVANITTEVPFRESLLVSVTNPTASKITISGMEFDAIVLKNGFYRELAKVMNGSDTPVSP